jgi:hypothetical protein
MKRISQVYAPMQRLASKIKVRECKAALAGFGTCQNQSQVAVEAAFCKLKLNAKQYVQISKNNLAAKGISIDANNTCSASAKPA